MVPFLCKKATEIAQSRPPDQVIGGRKNPYLLRWYLIPKNRFLNLYLHVFLRSDDDRALHDHPWCNLSLLLRGEYTEHTIQQGGIHRRVIRRAGDWKLRSASSAHRIELHSGSCMTLFLTGPKTRDWGFHCPETGWVPWQQFTAQGGTDGFGSKGCTQ